MRRLSVVLMWIALLSLVAAAALWWFAQPLVGSVLTWLDQSLREFWSRPYSGLGSFGLTVTYVIRTVVFLAVLWFVTRMTSTLLRRRVLDKTWLDEGQKFSLQRVCHLLALQHRRPDRAARIGRRFEQRRGGSAGRSESALGFGFQTIAKNFASGLILLVEQPVKVGDRVEVGNLLGDIVHIGSRGTWIRTNENVVMIVPNSEFIEGRVTNWTANDRSVRINVPLGVSYDSDPKHVRSVLLRVARDHPDVLDTPPSDVVFTGFGDNSIDFELRVWTTKQVTTPKVIASDLYFELFAAFKEEGLEIPFPQRDLHLRSGLQTVPALSEAASPSAGMQRDADARPGD